MIRQRHRAVCVRRSKCNEGEGARVSLLFGASGQISQGADIARISRYPFQLPRTVEMASRPWGRQTTTAVARRMATVKSRERLGRTATLTPVGRAEPAGSFSQA